MCRDAGPPRRRGAGRDQCANLRISVKKAARRAAKSTGPPPGGIKKAAAGSEAVMPLPAAHAFRRRCRQGVAYSASLQASLQASLFQPPLCWLQASSALPTVSPPLLMDNDAASRLGLDFHRSGGRCDIGLSHVVSIIDWGVCSFTSRLPSCRSRCRGLWRPSPRGGPRGRTLRSRHSGPLRLRYRRYWSRCRRPGADRSRHSP